MIRKIVHIDEEKCNGCGACANACHESAIGMVNGKAKLLRDDYCDGMGDCLPECPTGAISFEEREAAEYDEAAVAENKQKKLKEQMQHGGMALHQGGCPGTQNRDMRKPAVKAVAPADVPADAPVFSAAGFMPNAAYTTPQLAQWPCQIKLAPVRAPFFEGAKLLIAADCTAYAYASMHNDFMKGRITLIGCPKLDAVDYSEKLTAIIKNNDIQSVTIVRMEVPCCGGLEMAAKKALQASGKFIPWQVVTISIDGKILDR